MRGGKKEQQDGKEKGDKYEQRRDEKEQDDGKEKEKIM